MTASPAECRVCGGRDLVCVGRIRPYLDFEAPIRECRGCGARLAHRDPEIYEALHASGRSSYGAHETLATRVEAHFRAGDRAALTALLWRSRKNAFVLGAARDRGPLRVLEIGCSRGYLGAWFLLHGHDYLGVDVAESAVDAATERFGPHFRTALEGPGLDEGFDLIVHVGTIGCVEAPTALTGALLDRLRPGGRLRFNAPDVAAARAFGDPWVSSTPPPDLVTLFDGRYWPRAFGDRAEVRIHREPENTLVALEKSWRKLSTGSSLPAPTGPLLPAPDDAPARRPPRGPARWLRGLLTRAPRVARWVPAEFGQHVEMTVLRAP